MEKRPKCFHEQRDDIRACRTALHLAPISHTLREPIQCVETTLYLGVTLDKQLTWSPHIVQVRKKTAQSMGMLGPLLNRKSDLSVRNGVLLYKQLIRHMMDYACPRGVPLPAPLSGGYRCYSPIVFALLLVPPCT